MQNGLKKVRRVLDKFVKAERYICCALLVVILIICFCSVVMRYVFSKPWSWSEEVIIVLLVWFGFLCMSIETYNDTNIAVSGFYKNFPKPVQKACDVLRHVLMAVFFWLMASNAYKIFLVNSRKRLPASHWNQGLQYFPMVLGGALMLVFSIINIIGALINEKRELTSDTVVIEEKREGGEEA